MLHLWASILLFNLVACLTPKRLTPAEMYSTSLFALLLQTFTDVILDLKYDLYGYFNPGLDLQTFIPILGIYPAGSIIYLNLFPYRRPVLRKMLYILGWTAFSLIYEQTAIAAGWFYFNGWTSFYSALAYPVIYCLLAGNLWLLRRLSRP